MSKTINAREEEMKISDLQDGDAVVIKNLTCTHNHTRWHEYEEWGITTEWSYHEAIAWWITSSFWMPNTKPAITSSRLVDDFFEQGKDLPIRTYMHFWARDDNFQECDTALAHPRVVSLKVYPAWKDETGEAQVVTTSFAWTKAEVFDHSPEPGHTLDHLAQMCIKHNKPMIIHCETPNMWHTPIAEEHYIDHTVLPLCQRYPELKFVVAHTTLLSTAQKVIESNRTYGTDIYMELTPHHLWFTVDQIKEEDENILECYPRLRQETDRAGLLNLLTQIWTDPAIKLMHGTDHAPHTKEAKKNGSRGIPNFRDTVPMFLTLAQQTWLTTTQLQLFFRWIAEECYPLLREQEKTDMYTSVQKMSYIPPLEYYNWVVWNPIWWVKLEWKVIV